MPLPSWINRPVEQSAKLQSMPGHVEEPDRLAFRYPAGLPEGTGGQTASRARPFWEPFAAVTWRAWLMAAWLAVVLFQILRLAVQRLRLARLLRRGTAADDDLTRVVAELAGAIGLRRVPAAVTVAADCPLFVCGMVRPRLVLPSRLMVSLDESRRRQVILHELAHIKRHDLPWGWPVEIARDGVLLPSVGLLGGLSTAAGTGTVLRPTGDGPQRPKAGRLRPDVGSSCKPRLRARGHASGRHRRRFGG